jgi:hypothetical protein
MIFHLFIQHFQEGYSPFIRSFYVYNEEGATAMKSEAYDSVKGPRGGVGYHAPVVTSVIKKQLKLRKIRLFFLNKIRR